MPRHTQTQASNADAPVQSPVPATDGAEERERMERILAGWNAFDRANGSLAEAYEDSP